MGIRRCSGQAIDPGIEVGGLGSRKDRVINTPIVTVRTINIKIFPGGLFENTIGNVETVVVSVETGALRGIVIAIGENNFQSLAIPVSLIIVETLRVNLLASVAILKSQSGERGLFVVVVNNNSSRAARLGMALSKIHGFDCCTDVGGKVHSAVPVITACAAFRGACQNVHVAQGPRSGKARKVDERATLVRVTLLGTEPFSCERHSARVDATTEAVGVLGGVALVKGGVKHS
jgi:hypothetical protein